MFYLQSYIYLLFWSYLFLHLRNSHLVMEKKKTVSVYVCFPSEKFNNYNFEPFYFYIYMVKPF